MAEFDFAQVWQAVGLVVGTAIIAVGARLGTRRGDGTPPADRSPAPHEMRDALADIRRLIERYHDLTDDDLNDIKRSLDRIEATQRLHDAVADIRREYGKGGA